MGAIIRRWRGDEAKELIRQEIARRLRAAAIAVQNHAKQLISVAGTGVRVATGRLTKGYARKLAVRERKRARRAEKARVRRKAKTSRKRKQFIAKIANKAIRVHNKYAPAMQRTKIKKRVRVTKGGKLTTRRKARRKRPGTP